MLQRVLLFLEARIVGRDALGTHKGGHCPNQPETVLTLRVPLSQFRIEVLGRSGEKSTL